MSLCADLFTALTHAYIHKINTCCLSFLVEKLILKLQSFFCINVFFLLPSRLALIKASHICKSGLRGWSHPTVQHVRSLLLHTPQTPWRPAVCVYPCTNLKKKRTCFTVIRPKYMYLNTHAHTLLNTLIPLCADAISIWHYSSFVCRESFRRPRCSFLHEELVSDFHGSSSRRESLKHRVERS